MLLHPLAEVGVPLQDRLFELDHGGPVLADREREVGRGAGTMMSRRVFWVFCGFIIRAEIT